MKNVIQRGVSLAKQLMKDALLMLIALSLVLPTIAEAQTGNGVVPGGSVNTQTSSIPQSTGGAPNCASQGGCAILGDMGTDGLPREALPGNIGPNTEMVTWQEYHARWPKATRADFERIQRANGTICDEAQGIVNDVYGLQMDFASSDDDYANLQQIYDALPGKMKKHAAVMTVTSAVTTGALCALTAGLYCIAAIASGGGNIIGIHGNLKMQLASIQLSQANIKLSRTTIRADQVWGRSMTLWVRLAMPACHVINPAYGIPSGMNVGGVYSNPAATRRATDGSW